MRTVRRAWLIFGLLLTCGIITFTVSVDWSTRSWLDLAAYAVSVVAIVGVIIYAFGGAPHGAVFWRAFRWVFVGVAAAQVSVHSIAAAKQHGYSAAGTAAFFTVIAIMMGWILALQWVALTRLATEE